MGTQGHFDRFIRLVDLWAVDKNKSIIAQIGNCQYKPKNIDFVPYMSSWDVEQRIKSADVVISHAGMGTIITGLKYKKRILVFPRLSRFFEHRNDHQVDTAKAFLKLGYIDAAFSEAELIEKLGCIENLNPITQDISDYASRELLSALRSVF
ncbi:MAG: hypothetical protein JXR70_06495 [Spirochaetales bacterium]|nr:hypothetical protein [Spirochaetales bacterium]